MSAGGKVCCVIASDAALFGPAKAYISHLSNATRVFPDTEPAGLAALK